MSDTYFEDMQCIHIEDNFKQDYKFCKGSEGCVDITEGSAKYTARQKCVIGLHAEGTTLYVFENKFCASNARYEETCKMLRLKQRCVWRRKLDPSEIRSETPGKF